MRDGYKRIIKDTAISRFEFSKLFFISMQQSVSINRFNMEIVVNCQDLHHLACTMVA